ncbi:MAG: hypothetical protein AAFQ21_07680 [Pseudomonadota bacterium]
MLPLTRRTGLAIGLVVALTAVIGAAVYYFGVDDLVSWIEAVWVSSGSAAVVGAVVLFAWSVLLFLTVLPLGSVTIMLAGALLGAWAGWVQFVALILASQVLFETAEPTKRETWSAFYDGRPRLTAILTTLKTRGLATTIVLRLAPVIPSSVCTLSCVGLGVSREKFLLGTLLSGWVRPVILGLIGAHLGQAAIARLTGAGG